MSRPNRTAESASRFLLTIALVASGPSFASAQATPTANEVTEAEAPTGGEVKNDAVGKDLFKDDSETLEKAPDMGGPKTMVVVEGTEEGLPEGTAIEFGDAFDWIQLKSGEWLKGNIERMRDGSIEFDSDELKLLTLDWKDIIELHSPKANTYTFVGLTEVVGPAMINREFVVIQTVDGLVTMPRSELLSIIEHKPRERNYWSTILRFGLTGNAGNTEQVTYNVYWQLVREDSLTKAFLSYDGTFGSVSGDQTVNRHLGSGDVNIYISNRFYLKPLTGQLLYDRFQNIRLRATPAAGAGVYLIDKPNFNWDAETAIGYQYLSLLSPAAGVEDPQNDAYVMLRTFADIDFTDDIQLLLDWRSNVVFTTIGNTNHVGSADLSIEVTSIFNFNFSFLYLRTEEPAPREDGTVPKKNDYQFVIGVSLEIG